MIKTQRLVGKYFLFAFLTIGCFHLKAQNKTIILGRPTDNSVTISIAFDQNVEYLFEYGTQSGVYTNTSAVFTNVANTPDEKDLTGLTANTKYFYRVKYKTIGASNYIISSEYAFITQRAKGSTYTFTIESDEHLYDKKGVKSMYQVCLNNQANDKPDFMLSLGDIFGDDHNPFTITSAELDLLHANYRPFLGSICHSIPFYVCLGNHEGENDYYLGKTPPNNLAIWGTLARKNYYPNPFPNSFYSGNTDVEPYGVGNPENYYAWTWGDAQFIVLDVYRDECDTSDKPQGWNWSLGLPQYTWLKNTLEASTSKYKFVFAHHIRGQGRGGVTNAQLYEWGGLNKLGGTNTFAANRPGWAKPIHQLFIDNKVNIFFQGHDHVFAHEILDSITYQSTPMAADSTYEIGMLANAGAYVSDTIAGTGHLRVTVSPNFVKVDFVRAYLPADTLSGAHKNGEVAFSYTVGGKDNTGEEEELETSDIKLYPNPASDYVSILSSQNYNLEEVNIYNSVGQLQLQTHTNTFDIGSFSNGIYFVNIKTENALVVKKLVVNK
ncbi:MAG: T9SS type A sorting domain-containing protein [Bacteroidia bacterium]